MKVNKIKMGLYKTDSRDLKSIYDLDQCQSCETIIIKLRVTRQYIIP
jgi:hypothetical protein